MVVQPADETRWQQADVPTDKLSPGILLLCFTGLRQTAGKMRVSQWRSMESYGGPAAMLGILPINRAGKAA